MPFTLVTLAGEPNTDFIRTPPGTPKEIFSSSRTISSDVSEYGLSDDGLDEADFSYSSEESDDHDFISEHVVSSSMDYHDDEHYIENSFHCRKNNAFDQESFLPSIQVIEIDDLNGQAIPLFHPTTTTTTTKYFNQFLPSYHSTKIMSPPNNHQARRETQEKTTHECPKILDKKTKPTSRDITIIDSRKEKTECYPAGSHGTGISPAINISRNVRPPVCLFTFGDDKNLTPYDCLLRKQLEYFEPSQSIILTHTRESLRQETPTVGIRCRHCAHEWGHNGAIYPVRTTDIAASAHSLAIHHMVTRCPFVSTYLRDEILRGIRERTCRIRYTPNVTKQQSEQYWFETAQLIGIGSTMSSENQSRSGMLRWTSPYEPGVFPGRRHLPLQYYNYKYRSDPSRRRSRPFKVVPPASMITSS